MMSDQEFYDRIMFFNKQYGNQVSAGGYNLALRELQKKSPQAIGKDFNNDYLAFQREFDKSPAVVKALRNLADKDLMHALTSPNTAKDANRGTKNFYMFAIMSTVGTTHNDPSTELFGNRFALEPDTVTSLEKGQVGSFFDREHANTPFVIGTARILSVGLSLAGIGWIVSEVATQMAINAAVALPALSFLIGCKFSLHHEILNTMRRFDKFLRKFVGAIVFGLTHNPLEWKKILQQSGNDARKMVQIAKNNAQDNALYIDISSGDAFLYQLVNNQKSYSMEDFKEALNSAAETYGDSITFVGYKRALEALAKNSSGFAYKNLEYIMASTIGKRFGYNSAPVSGDVALMQIVMNRKKMSLDEFNSELDAFWNDPKLRNSLSSVGFNKAVQALMVSTETKGNLGMTTSKNIFSKNGKIYGNMIKDGFVNSHEAIKVADRGSTNDLLYSVLKIGHAMNYELSPYSLAILSKSKSTSVASEYMRNNPEKSGLRRVSKAVGSTLVPAFAAVNWGLAGGPSGLLPLVGAAAIAPDQVGKGVQRLSKQGASLTAMALSPTIRHNIRDQREARYSMIDQYQTSLYPRTTAYHGPAI